MSNYLPQQIKSYYDFSTSTNSTNTREREELFQPNNNVAKQMYHFRLEIKKVFEASENQALEQYSNVNSTSKRVLLSTLWYHT